MGIELIHSTSNSTSPTPRRSLYWFEDATLTIRIEDTDFRIHHSLIARHSPLFGSLDASLDINRPTEALLVSADALFTTNDPCGYQLIATETVAARDFEVLLAHLYHDEYVLRIHLSLIDALHETFDFRTLLTPTQSGP